MHLFKSYKAKAALALSLLITAQQGISATVSGRVITTENNALAGAIVTLWNEERTQKLSTYTDTEGRFSLDTDFIGATTLRGRSPYYRDVNMPVQLSADAVVEQYLLLEKMMDPAEISATLPASAHVSKLNLNDENDRGAFITQCNFCHQQGNSLTRTPRSEQAWSDTVWRMEGYGAFITDGEHKAIKNILHEGFNGEPIAVEQTQDYSPELAETTIHEWLVATPMSFLHDTVVGRNGKLYGIDEGADTIWEFDRETDEVIANKIPNTEGLAVGGNFEGAQLAIGIFTGHHGPHSGAQISDGRMFITAALSSNLVMFHPDTKQWKLYPIPRGFLWRKGLYSHTIRADKDDNVWFTVLASNMVMKFDTRTEKFTEIKLPANGTLKWMSDTFMGVVLKIAAQFPSQNYQLGLSHHKWLNGGRDVLNWPYGIDINPVDGGVWYAKLMGNKIGHIDPETLEVTEFDTPFKGPRRMHFGKDGIL